jgi:hypothetical protein
MKIFISWYGPRSKVLAEALKEWMKMVLQATRPWISTRDIPQKSVLSIFNSDLKASEFLGDFRPDNFDFQTVFRVVNEGGNLLLKRE